MTISSYRTTLFALLISLSLVSNPVAADHDGQLDLGAVLLEIAPHYLFANARQDHERDRSRRQRGQEFDRGHQQYERNLHQRHGSRQGYVASYTSEPIRGGSSRRTRIIENPFPNRPITGISFSGIERDAVHINDVITYPRKRQISHRGYSLSRHHPSPFLSTRGYVDYISVKAKRKEYFTVTFHYE